MKKNYFLHLLGISFLLLATACTTDSDPTVGSAEDAQPNQISNGAMSLLYGSEDLARYVSTENSPVSFVKFDGGRHTAGPLSGKSYTYTPDLTGAIAATGNNFYNINRAETYYIPAGTAFTGGFNFNSAGKIIVLGNWGGSSSVNVPSKGKVEVGPTGYINTSVNLNLNSGSQLDNYGTVNYTAGSISGGLNNYADLRFNRDINIDGSAKVFNFCKMTFEGNNNSLNAPLTNSGYMTFLAGFSINGNGALNLNAGSFAEVKGGTLNIDGKIKNTESGFARLDISNARFGNVNAAPAIMGKIDVNFTNTNYSIFQNNSTKADANVSFNGNTFIQGNECIPQKGIPACNDQQLQFTLVANVASPTVGGKLLSATGVTVAGTYAYVSYHTNDEIYDNSPYGAVRIFNIADAARPVLVNEAQFNDAEFNGIDITDNQLYAVGGNKKGAKLVTAPLSNGTFNTTDLSVFKEFSLPGSSAKNSFYYNNSLWTVSGAANGGYFKLNPAEKYAVSSHLYTNGERAKYAAHNSTHQAFFAVETGGALLKIAKLDGSDWRTFTYPTLKQSVLTGKNAMTMDQDYIYVALSDRGVAKIKISTGELVNHFVPADFKNNGETVFKGGLTNAVAVSDCYLYLANGGDGVIVLNKNTFNVVGYYRLGSAASANYIYISRGMIFVGNGTGGLSILKIN